MTIVGERKNMYEWMDEKGRGPENKTSAEGRLWRGRRYEEGKRKTEWGKGISEM